MMNHRYSKRSLLILAILLLIPILFILIPKHTFTKKLKSEDPLTFSSRLEPEFDGLPNEAAPKLGGFDGPYIIREKNKTVEINVVEELGFYQVVKKEIPTTTDGTFTCLVDNKDKDSFTFKLRETYEVPPYEYPQPEKLIAISDFEGNFDAFYSLMVANEVMDTAYNWTYGNGHLVIAGDMMDRGVNVTQCLWLIYKLEQEAEKVGGQVHFILGNHEVMNLHGEIEYVDPKYIALALKLSEKEIPRNAYLKLMSRNQELVKWMRTKNIMEKVGNMLFVHGGISSQLVRSKMSLKRINRTARKMLSKNYALAPIENSSVRLINGRMGPLWYRGMATKRGKYYDKATPKEVNKVLKRFDVKHVVIGHTPMNQMHTDYNGSVVTINLIQPKAKFTGKAKAFLAENGVFYEVNDFGKKKELLNL